QPTMPKCARRRPRWVSESISSKHSGEHSRPRVQACAASLLCYTAREVSARMPEPLEAVRPIQLREILEARQRIAGTILRTPVVRLELGQDFPDVRLKLENLQPINAYKLRGAANAV